MDNIIAAQFTRYLKEGEIIYWCGKPIGGWRLTQVDAILIPMSIILFGFSACLDYVIITFHSIWLFKGLGVLCTLLALYMVFFRFYIDKRRRESTYYCLTNRRVLVLSGITKQKCKTLPLADIRAVIVNEEKDGYGHIVINNTNPVLSWLFGSFMFAQVEIPGFEMIPDVNKVYSLFITVIEESTDRLGEIHPN